MLDREPGIDGCPLPLAPHSSVVRRLFLQGRDLLSVPGGLLRRLRRQLRPRFDRIRFRRPESVSLLLPFGGERRPEVLTLNLNLQLSESALLQPCMLFGPLAANPAGFAQPRDLDPGAEE